MQNQPGRSGRATYQSFRPGSACEESDSGTIWRAHNCRSGGRCGRGIVTDRQRQNHYEHPIKDRDSASFFLQSRVIRASSISNAKRGKDLRTSNLADEACSGSDALPAKVQPILDQSAAARSDSGQKRKGSPAAFVVRYHLESGLRRLAKVPPIVRSRSWHGSLFGCI